MGRPPGSASQCTPLECGNGIAALGRERSEPSLQGLERKWPPATIQSGNCIPALQRRPAPEYNPVNHDSLELTMPPRKKLPPAPSRLELFALLEACKDAPDDDAPR